MIARCSTRTGPNSLWRCCPRTVWPGSRATGAPHAARRACAGSWRRELSAVLGADVLAFAQQAQTGPWSRPADLDADPVMALAGRVDRIGRAALRAVFQAAGPELGRRADLRLEEDPDDEPPEEGWAPLDLTLAVLEQIEPTWHSSFLATH